MESASFFIILSDIVQIPGRIRQTGESLHLILGLLEMRTNTRLSPRSSAVAIPPPISKVSHTVAPKVPSCNHDGSYDLERQRIPQPKLPMDDGLQAAIQWTVTDAGIAG